MESISVKKRKCSNSSPVLEQEHLKGGEFLNMPVRSRKVWHSDELKFTSRPCKARAMDRNDGSKNFMNHFTSLDLSFLIYKYGFDDILQTFQL